MRRGSSSPTTADTELAPDASESTARPRRTNRRAARWSGDPFFVVLVVIALAKAELSRQLGLRAGNPIATLALEAAAIILVLGVADILTKRRSYTVDLIAYTLLSVLMLANVIYLSFFDQIFSPSLLSVVGQAGAVADSIQSLMRRSYLLYLIDIPFLIAWAVALRRAGKRPPAPRSRRVAIATVVALLVLVVQVVFVLRLGDDVDGSAIARVRGFGAYQIATVVRFVTPGQGSTAVAFERVNGQTPAQAMQNQIKRIRKADEGPRIVGVRTGQYHGKNVILIQVEALQTFLIDKKYNGQEITPNVNALVAQSWYFPNMFSQISGGNTVDAEFTVNTSLLPPVAGAASLEYSNRLLPGLPRLLRNSLGYDAFTLHQNDVRFWNRKELYPALGFARYWDRSYFKMKDKMWHASDQVLFGDGMKVLETAEAKPKPFYAAFVTESSHVPWVAVRKNRYAIDVSAADSATAAGRYIGSISYTDKAIGEFLDALKKNGMYDDSIIVIYGDHGSAIDVVDTTQTGKNLVTKILGCPYSWVDRQRIPLIIHLPQQKTAQVQTKPLGQIDVMPTIADLVGLDISQVPHLGRSAFVDSGALVEMRAYVPSGSFINNDVLFMPQLSFDDGSAVRVLDGSPAAPSGTERADLARIKELSRLSDAWVRSLPIRPDAGNGKDAIIPK